MDRWNAWFALSLTLLMLPLMARAEDATASLAEANRVAMDAYNNLDIEIAQEKLEKALSNAEQAGINGPPLARTYANLGVVCVGGLRDDDCGLDAFMRALEEDLNVELDPLVSSPEIQRVFNRAKAKLNATGPLREPGVVEGNLVHTPVRQQLAQTGVPVYVEPGALAVASMQVFYRSLGMPKHKSGQMRRMGRGFGYVIPCTDVFEPEVEYYVVAYDASGKQIGNAGTPTHSVSISIVRELRGPPPSLPGEPPLERCSDRECPPGMPNCRQGRGGMGDTCTHDSECDEGLSCQDNFCSVAANEPPAEEEEQGDQAKFFLDLGASFGAAYVGQNMKADVSPPASLFDGAPSNLTPAEAQTIANAAGWACQVREVDRTLYDCTVAVENPGFVPTMALQGVAGYHVTPRVYIGASGRFQLDEHGEGTLAGIVVGGRLGYMLTQPRATGLRASLFMGVDIGQIQVRPESSGGQGPFVASGLGGLPLGASLGYRFTRNFGLVAIPYVHFMLPTFLFVADAMGAVEIAF